MTTSVSAIQTQLTDLTAKIKTLPVLGENERQQLLETSRSLVRQMETPKERIARMMWHEPLILTSTRLLIDLDVFGLLVQAGKPQTAEQLSIATGADESLLQRLLKHVATDDYVHETAPDTYVASDITRTLATPEAAGCVKDMFQMLKVYDHLPDFLRQTKYATPRDKDASPWTCAYDTKLHYFDWVMADPERIAALNGHMQFKNLGLQWYEEPNIVNSALGSGVGPDEVLLVDVGGNAGHQLTGFRCKHPRMSGRLVLQDLPGTIDQLDKVALRSAGVEAIAHDFFSSQPIKDAKAYYLKMVLHDWPKKECISILQNLRPALRASHSKILINEIVVPDQGAQWFQTSIDMLMLSCHAAQERREWEWRELVEEVGGLKIDRIWDVAGAVEKVIEVEAI